MTAAVERKADSQQQQSPAVFSRHETFPPRNGWLKKGFDAVEKAPDVFTRDDAAIVLGVGKNMAKAIKYWALAFKILEEKIDKESKTKTLVPTKLGTLLLSADGYDPFIEDTATLWLLHWHLLKAPCLASSWWFAFNTYRHPEFTQDDFLTELTNYVKQVWSENSFSDSTLKNDVSCLVRMYCKDESARYLSEETIASPFSDLNLLTKEPSGKHITFCVGSKATLPDQILAATCLDYAASMRNSESSINVSQLLYGLGSPGLVFKITESILCTALENIAAKRRDIILSDTGGIVQLQFRKDPEVISHEIVRDFYTAKGAKR